MAIVHPEERVILVARPHGLVLLSWLTGIALFAALSVLLLALTTRLAVGEVHLVLVGVCVILGWGVASWNWRRRRLVLTDRRLIGRHGILGRQRRAIPLLRIQRLSHRSGIGGRLFGYGDLVVESAAPRGRVIFRRLLGPDCVQMRMERQIRWLRRPHITSCASSERSKARRSG